MTSLVQRLGPFAVYSNIFLVMLGLGVVAPMLSDIQSDLDVSYSMITWATGAFAIARLITDYPAGLASERFPRALVLVGGSTAVCIGSLVGAVADDILVLGAARAFSGVGSAITTTVGLTVVLDAAPAHSRGRASAMYHSALGAGAFFGPGLGGLVATVGGWRLAMAMAGVAAMVSCLLLVAVYAANALPRRPSSDTDEAAQSGSDSPPVSTLLRVAAPAFIAAFAIFYARGAAQHTLIPLAGRDAVGLSALSLSIVLMASAAVGTVLGPFVGSWSDRIGRERLLLGGLAGLVVGCVASTSATSFVVFAAGIAALSLAGTTFSLPSSMIIDRVDPRRRAQAIGMYRVIGDSALSLGPIVTGFLVGRTGFGGAGLSVAVVVGVVLLLWRPMTRFAGEQEANATLAAEASVS